MPGKKDNYWPILTISLIAIAAFALFILHHATTPSDGARIAPGGFSNQGVEIKVINPQSNSLQSGDMITAIEGISIKEWTVSLTGQPPAEINWQLGETLTYTVLREETARDVPVTLKPYSIWAALRADWGTIAYGLAFLIVATYVFVRRPDNRAGRILFIAGGCITAQTAWSFGLSLNDIMDGKGYWLFLLCTSLFYNLNWIVLFHFSLVFPQPAPILRHRWLLPVLYAAPLLLIVAEKVYLFSGSVTVLDWLASSAPVENIHTPLFLLMSILAVIWQARHSTTTKERQQIRWLLFASIAIGMAVFLLYILPGALGLEQIPPNYLGLIIISFPVALGIAILRHNIFDIDTLINRALVYSALTVGTMLLYVALVGSLANLLNIQQRTLTGFLTTGLVAVLFHPLRDQLQRWVNRLMYGDRDDPYTVLSQFGQQIDAAYGSDDILPSILETVANALKLPYAAMHLSDTLSIHYGDLPVGIETEKFPLRFRGQTFGMLEVSPRAVDEPFLLAEQRLLVDLSRQIEAAVRNVRLTADLQSARHRLVTAREEERRRIRRDLHDGLGPTLASQVLMLDAIEETINPEQKEMLALIHSLRTQSRDAIDDIRRLVYDLRPPELDNLGLVEALRQGTNIVSQGNVNIVFDVPTKLPPLSAAVEMAVYRVAQEALTNVVKHADATHATVRLEPIDDKLHLEVIDNGKGLPAEMKFGVGMNSMQERTEELGGDFSISNSPRGGIRISIVLSVE